MTPEQPTIDDIGRLVQILAVATRDIVIRPHRASNLVQPALLAQLRSAIVPDGVSGAAGKAAHERIVINAAALDLYDYINGRIQHMYQQATELDAKGSPEELLTSWLIRIAMDAADGSLNDVQAQHAYDRLDDIRTRIMDLLNPPELGDIEERPGVPARCPECGWSRVTIPGPDGPIPKPTLVQLSRPWRDNEISARCRQCNTTWVGETRLLELAYYIGMPVQHVISASTTEETPQ